MQRVLINYFFFVVVYPDRCTLCLAALGNSQKVQQKLSFWDDVYGEGVFEIKTLSNWCLNL